MCAVPDAKRAGVVGDLAHVHDRVAAALEDLEGLFVRGAKLTFVMRMPGNDDACIVVTADRLEDVERILRQRREADRG